MPRPPKIRWVEYMPCVTSFKPAGIPLRELEEVVLTVEELEAVRLKDLEGLEQEEGAERMRVSRPTFQRILVSAHRKIADALVSGKAIRVEGGAFQFARRILICQECGREVEWPRGGPGCGRDLKCPECGGRVGSGGEGPRGHGHGGPPWKGRP